MRRRSVLGGMVVAAGVSSPCVSTSAPRRSTTLATPVLDSLAMPVTPEQNRQYSYTDKVSGYFHGRTHMDDNPDWFNGWNIATKRIFRDYALSVDGVPLSRTQANVVVSPHKLVRRFEGATETLTLLDGMAILVVGVGEVRGQTIGLALKGDLTDVGTLAPEGVWYAPKEAVGTQFLVAPFAAQTVRLDPLLGIVAPKAAAGFYLIHAPTKPAALALLSRVRRGTKAMLAARARRMEALVSGNNALDAGDPDRTKALLWMRLTTDQLVMKQMGTGIYAGLPWFNDYWGRDTFISITGALFVTGQYEIAADVFRSFAALQDVDPKSKTYGRVPNRARPDGIEYNSADGTPRFIITLADLIRRSGNIALARELWPAVKRAVEGVLKNNVDELGLITHDDADTWMDAKEKGVRAWSPRGNRAIDVQALWFSALWSAMGLAEIAFESTSRAHGLPKTVSDWQLKTVKATQKLDSAIAAFRHPVTGYWVDHLKTDGTQDLKVRPNVLFALEVLGIMREQTRASIERDMAQVRDVWQGLVYPWGVATLAQTDPDFYPYHEHWHYYHKDAAYHNGTVWPWLNGPMIQQMVRFNQVEPAWRLFENMNRQALSEGAVGSLAECADALPIGDVTWSRRTGTFLQAWSNAEQLRVWQEVFLGVRKFQLDEVIVRPRLPTRVNDVRCSFAIGIGRLEGHFNIGGADKWRFVWTGPRLALTFNALFYGEVTDKIYLESGWSVAFSKRDNFLVSQCYDARNQVEGPENIVADLTGLAEKLLDDPARPASELERHEIENRIFAGLDFCKPLLRPNLKSLSVRHDPPLTY